MNRLQVIKADITKLAVDAIVNAANEWMLGGGGVDGAIHAAAGPELLEACRRVPEVRPGVRCPTGEARLTPAFELPARFVIHTVGPVWHGGEHGEAERLASSYRSVFALVREHGIRTIAFPAISCGVFGYPLDEAASISVREVRRALGEQPQLEQVSLVAFNQEVLSAFSRAAEAPAAEAD